jgi:glyceraldehyde-3-phosphate dehydrogenase (NADP+)
MKMIIGGKWVDKDERIEVLDPQDETVIDTVPAGDPDDVRRAFEIAEKGAEVMRKLATYDRYEILKKAAEILESRLEEFSVLVAKEGVKTIREARKEAARAVNTLTYAAEEAKRLEGEIVHFDADFRRDRRVGYWLREPVGIVLAITPYNDPLNMVAHKLSPAIAAGNAVVLKPATVTPLSALKFGEILLEAGMPEEAISIITGSASKIGDALVTDPRPRVITFTGGTEAGEDILKKAGLKKVMMELGSSSAVIVMDDANLKEAVPSIVSGCFWAAGQNCIGVQRLYLHRKIYDRFMDEFIDQTSKMKVGNKLDESTDMGPMISREEADRVESWVEEAISLGGKALTGRKRDGNFYWPTILENVPKKAKVVCREIFGPVVVVFPFDTLEEAVREANDTEYGLHAAIFTENLDNAFYAAKELRFGGIMVNDSTDFRVDYMPFGGYKKSGLFREGLKFAIDVMTEIKLVAFNVRR